MRYWLDTEFIEDGHTIELISLGMVAEDGREFYAESSEVDFAQASEWVASNVFPHLWSRQADKRSANEWSRDGGVGGLLTRRNIAIEVRMFCDPEEHGKPEFWGYYADYDWVVLCQLFGRMIDLPKGWPMYCRDIKQWCDELGNPKLPEQDSTEHHALADAQWNQQAWAYLKSLAVDTAPAAAHSPVHERVGDAGREAGAAGGGVANVRLHRGSDRGGDSAPVAPAAQ